MAVPEKKKITAEEFFAVTPENDRNHVELIGGEIISFASPTVRHQSIVLAIGGEIRNFIKNNNGGCKPFVSPFDVKLDEYTVVQPDVLVVCDPDKLSDGKRCSGAPELVIEVTSSNRDYDHIDKLYLYRNSGVREYWIVDTKYNRIIIYKFGDEDNPYIYTFDQDVPVGIFENKLSLNIDKML